MVLLKPAEIFQGQGLYLSFLRLLILFVFQLLLLASFSYDKWQKSERTNQGMNGCIVLFLTHPLTFHRPNQTMWWNSKPTEQRRYDWHILAPCLLTDGVVDDFSYWERLRIENNFTEHFEKSHIFLEDFFCLKYKLYLIYLLTNETKSFYKLPIHFPSLKTQIEVIMGGGGLNWCKS